MCKFEFSPIVHHSPTEQMKDHQQHWFAAVTGTIRNTWLQCFQSKSLKKPPYSAPL